MSNNNQAPRHDQERVEIVSAELDVGTVPDRIQIVPWGQVSSSNGDFVVDEEAVELALAAFAAKQTDLPIDYEHQTLGGQFASATGQAPAAGWIKSMEAEPGVGLFAQVEWTSPAAEQLAAKQYRYLSPVAIIRKSDRRLAELHSAALTNKPAIVGMKPIVNGEQPTAGLERLRGHLGVPADTEAEEVLVAAGEKIEMLTRRAEQHAIEPIIIEAMRAGKLTEAQREWATNLAMSDRESFDAWLRSAPVVVQSGRLAVPGSHDPQRHNGTIVAATARREFRSHPELALLTSEDAFVGEALRQSGLN